MKRMSIAIGLAAGLLVAGLAAAQPYGMGPGMMGGYGYGPGAGYGMGYIAGPGGYGMGPGMMGGGFRGDAYAGLDLTAEQRQKIAAIEQSTAKGQWQLMGTMHEQGYVMHGNGAGALDEAAARKSFDAMSDARKAMFELQIDARKKIDAVLTPQQREQLRR